jgi:hypothetical protein
VLLDEAQTGEFLDELAIDAGLGIEVEVVECPGSGQAGEAEASVELALLGGGDLDAEQLRQEGGVGHLLARCLFEQRGERLGGGLEAEVGGVGADLLIEAGLAHGRTPASRA